MPYFVLFSFVLYLRFLSVYAKNLEANVDEDAEAESPAYSHSALRQSTYSTRFGDVTWDASAWTLRTTTIRPNDFRSAAFTANGYIGMSMVSTGPFVQTFPESSGWPLFDQRQTFGTVSGFFDRQPTTNGTNFPWLSQYGWDSAISGIPSWTPLILELPSGDYLSANTSVSELSNVALTQDFRNGLVRWQYTWSPPNGSSLNISYTAFADKLHINRACVQLQVEPSEDFNVTITNVLDGSTALRANLKDRGIDGNFIYSAVSPVGVDEVTAWVYASMESSVRLTNLKPSTPKPYISASPASVAQSASVFLKAGETTTITKYVGVASADGFQDPQNQAKSAMSEARADGYSKSLQAHSTEWKQVLPSDHVSNYSNPTTGEIPPALVEKSIVEVVSIFGLLMNTIGDNAIALLKNASTQADAPLNSNGISVCGLTSDCYAGQRFWDEDTWMQPFLTASFPSAAKQITNNRVQQYPQAKKNIQTAYQSSKNGTVFSEDSAIYPWTSGRDANCTATGPCFDYEYHLNGDIALSFVSLWASSGDTEYFKDNLYDPLQSIASTFSDLLKSERNMSTYSLMNLTDPDEFANGVDNGGFTMPLAAFSLNSANWFREAFGQPRNTQWDEKASNLEIPTAGDISLEYSGMNGTIDVKQADVVLKVYPLAAANYSLASQLADLDYYAGRQSQDGPAMTYAIFSIDASEISSSGCGSYTYDLGSWSPYVREPWYSFSEQLIDNFTLNGGTNPAFPFLTGHGGSLQVNLYGYLGLRYTVDYMLYINPTLPPQIPYITYPTFYWQGWPIKAIANSTTTTLVRLSTPLPGANSTYATAPIPVIVGPPNINSNTRYSLPFNTTLSLPNRLPQTNKTIPGNILQCLTGDITTSSSYQPGQFPLAAIDGALSTSWQPTLASSPTSLTIATSTIPFQHVKGLYFNWAALPPINVTVVFHNESDPSTGQGPGTVVLTDIPVSDPYNETVANQVGSYRSNSTTVDLEAIGKEVWTGKWATLVVSGIRIYSDSGGVGATVAEWAVVGSL